MKYKKDRLPITDFINRNKIISIIIDASLDLFFFTIRLMIRPFAYKRGNLVVILLHRLGDTIFTIPAVREIQKHYGDKVIIFCFPESIPIYELALDDLKFCSVSQKEFYFGARIAKRSVKKKLRELRPEIIIDLTGYIISASLIFNIRSKKIIGFNREQFSIIYNLFNPGRVKPQLIDMYLDAIVPYINVPENNGLKNQQISSNPSGEILIHPFAGWREKEWNFKNFISLAERLNKDYSVCLITAAGQVSVDVLNDIEYAGVKVRQTASIEELIKCIKECSLFIGNDSGPIYISNFIGKPTITIHGSTSFEYTTTYLSHQICIQKVLKCSARQNEQYCTIRAAIYDCPGIQCMNLLTIDEVYDNATPLIEEYCNKKA